MNVIMNGMENEKKDKITKRMAAVTKPVTFLQMD
jgi:hypothetical protein